MSGPSTTSYDHALGCALVETEFSTNWTRLQSIDDPASGVALSGCSLPCQGPVPSNAPMQAARQHDLTEATVVAFFESVFRGSHAGRCFLRTSLAAENPDVHVERHRRGR